MVNKIFMFPPPPPHPLLLITYFLEVPDRGKLMRVWDWVYGV